MLRHVHLLELSVFWQVSLPLHDILERRNTSMWVLLLQNGLNTIVGAGVGGTCCNGTLGENERDKVIVVEMNLLQVRGGNPYDLAVCLFKIWSMK
jgi:hypothetical protein